MKIDDTKRLFVGQIVVGIFGLIGTIFIARYVGPAMFGFCASSILIASVVLDLIDFGSCSWSARELASGGISRYRYIEIMRKQTSKAFLITALTPIFFLFYPSKFEPGFLFLFYPALWLRTNYIQQFLIVYEKINQAIFLQLLERFFWLFYIMAGFLGLNEITTFVVPILTGLLAHGFLGTKLISQDGLNANEDFRNVRIKVSHYPRIKNFGIISVISDIGNLDGAVVAKVSSLSESGNYNLALRFRNPLQLSFQVFSTRLRPIAARKNKAEIRNFFKENQNFLAFGVLGIVVLSILAYKGAIFLFGDSFSGLNEVLAAGILCSIPNGIGAVCGSFITSVGLEKFIAKATVYYVFTNLIGIGVSAYFLGSFGAVLSSLICGVLLSLILLKKSFREFSKLN